MPTYEYACTDCGHRAEVVHSIHAEPLTVCEICGGRLRKVFHPVGVVLKGSGFYKTDSRAGAKGDSGSTDGKASGSDAGSGSGEKAGSGPREKTA